MGGAKNHVFVFSTPLSSGIMPLIQIALSGALVALGVEEKLSDPAALEFATLFKQHLDGSGSQPTGDFVCRSEKKDSTGEIVIEIDEGLDLRPLATTLSNSGKWKSFLTSAKYIPESGTLTLVIDIKHG